MENNDDARYQKMSFKLLEALEGGARSAGRQTLSSDAKPMTEGLSLEAVAVLDFISTVLVCKYRTQSFSKLLPSVISCLPKIIPNLVVR